MICKHKKLQHIYLILIVSTLAACGGGDINLVDEEEIISPSSEFVIRNAALYPNSCLNESSTSNSDTQASNINTSEVYKLESYAYDSDADGVLEGSVNYVYDGSGNLISKSSNSYIYTYTYDDSNNKLSSCFDNDLDGVTDRFEINTYDANGNLLSLFQNTDTIDELGLEETRTTTYTYDDNDRLLTENYSTFAWHDYPYEKEYSYDVNGNQLLAFSSETTVGGSEYLESTESTYDEDNNLLTIEYKYGLYGYQDTAYFYADEYGELGVYERYIYEIYSYDDAGNTLTRESLAVDGTRISLAMYSYNGNVTSIETVDREGVVLSNIVNTYDGGNLSSVETKYDKGVISAIVTNIYDDKDNVLSTKTAGSNSQIISRISNSYDSEGNLLFSETTDGDGLTVSSITNTYDDNGNLLSETKSNSSGVTNSTTHTIDAYGNILTISEDEDGDGVIDRITTKTWVKV